MNKGYLFILTTAFLFGTMETALKFFGSLFHPIQITVLRFFIGGFMLLPLARAALKTHGAVLTKKDYLFFAKAGFIGVFVSMIFYQLAVVYGKAAVSGVLFSCNPIFVAVWAHFLLHETIDRYVISSLVLSAVGILSIVNPFHFRGTYLSVILIMLAAVTFGLYSVMGRPACQRLGGVTVTSYSFIFGAAELLVLVLLGRTAPIGHLLTSATPSCPLLHCLCCHWGRLRFVFYGHRADESLDGFFGLFHQTDSCDFLCCHVPRGNCDAQYACWRRADSYWFPDEPLS